MGASGKVYVEDKGLGVSGSSLAYHPNELCQKAAKHRKNQDVAANKFMLIPDDETMGAFEVIFMGVLLYSKRKSGVWPNIPMVAKKCAEAYSKYVCGDDILAFEVRTMSGADNARSLSPATDGRGNYQISTLASGRYGKVKNGG